MTTVVGLAGAHAVWMSADTGTNVFDRPIYGAAKKIRRLVAADGTTAALLGITGSAAAISVMRKTFTTEHVQPLGDTDPEEWSYDIASRLTRAMVEAGLVDHETGQMDGTMLLGVPGHLWTLEHHMAIRLPDCRGAVGSGEAVAMGALDALLACGQTPDRAVPVAAGIAVERDQWSRPPLQHEILPAASPAGLPV